MLYDYLTPETYVQVSTQIQQDVLDLYPNVEQLAHEIEQSSTYLDPHLQIMSWLSNGAIYSNAWQLRQWMPPAFNCFTDTFVWLLYREIATNVVYEYIYYNKND